MRITLVNTVGVKFAFDTVEMLIIDPIDIVIWQPKVGHKGSRRTRLDPKMIVDLHCEVLNEEKIEDSKTDKRIKS